MDDCLCEWINEICQRHLPRVLSETLGPSVFYDFYVKPSSRYSLTRILPTSSPKSAPNVTVFENFRVQIELSLRVSCAFCWPHSSFWTFSNANPALAKVSPTFCRPHLPKALRDWQFLNIFKCKSTTFADRGPQLSETTETTLPEKNAGFRARESFQAWIHASRPVRYTSNYDMM